MTRKLCSVMLSLFIAFLAQFACAAPHITGPVPLSDETLQSIRESEFQMSDPGIWEKALFYADERTILWMDPSSGGFLRGIWLLEADGVVKSKAADGSIGAANLLFGGGYRILPALKKNGATMKAQAIPELNVKAVPEKFLTEITFEGHFDYTTDDKGDIDDIVYRAVYEIPHNKRLIDVHYEIQYPTECDLSSLLITLESLGSPYAGAPAPVKSRPVTGFSCGAWSSGQYFEGRGRAVVTQTGKTVSPLASDLSVVRNDASTDKRERSFVTLRKDHRKPWFGLYNGNWDEAGYKFGIDYSIVREFSSVDQYSRVALTEIPEFNGEKFAYCTVSADAALEPTPGASCIWKERLYLNRSDYQMYLRKTNQ